MKKNFLCGHFTQLLIYLSILFVVRPYSAGLLYKGFWHTILILVFISSIIHIDHHKIIKNLSIYIAIPSILLYWIDLFFPMKPLLIVAIILTIVFMFLSVVSIMKKVVIEARVKLETLRGAVCAYLLIAFSFAFIYALIEIIFPGSFNITSNHSIEGHYNFFSWIMYYSFVTLLTIGYGDLTPINTLSQSLSILEGISGQFYIAILVSRLVSVYSSSKIKVQQS